jgi:DNA mismatch repair ATPase MutS
MKKNVSPFTKQETYKVWQMARRKYLNAIVVVRLDDQYFTYDKHAVLLGKLTEATLSTYNDGQNECYFHLCELDSIISIMSKKGYMVAVCDPA